MERILLFILHLQSIKISPDVNEISENIDVMNKDTLESVRLLSSNSNSRDIQSA
jgi:hypothetical protein